MHAHPDIHIKRKILSSVPWALHPRPPPTISKFSTSFKVRPNRSLNGSPGFLKAFMRPFVDENPS